MDSFTVFADYTALAEAGKISRLPVLIGSNAQDGELFVPYSPDGVNTTLAGLPTKFFFFCPTY